MKYSFSLIILILFSTAILSQVPEPMREMPDAVEEPIRNHENAGYYQQAGKYGFVYPENTRQEAVYDKITYGLSGFIVTNGKLQGIADFKGRLISKVEFDSIGILNHDYLVKKNGKLGLISNLGIPLLSIKFDKIIGGNTYVTIIQNKKGESQLIFNKTEEIFSQKIEYANLYQNLAFVKVNGKFGVITDKIIVPFEYDSISYTISKKTNSGQKQNGNNMESINVNRLPIFNFMVLKNDKLGLINSEGSVIYPAENDEILRIDMKAYYLIKKDHLFSIYFPSAKKKTAFDFSRVHADGFGYVMATKNNKSGVFNLKGEEIAAFEYDNDGIYQYSGIGLRVAKNKKRGIIDFNGKVIVPIIYDDISTFYRSNFNNFIKVTLDNKVGVVNLKGEVIIPMEFEWIEIENNFFKVATPEPERKIGLYNKKGETVVPVEYQWITDSNTENSKITILVKDEHSYNFLNQKNELILPNNIREYGYILNEDRLLNPFFHSLYIKDDKGKTGMLNEMTGIVDIPMIYDKIIQGFRNGNQNYFSVQKGKKFGLINAKNEEIIPIKYDDINIDFVAETKDGNQHIVLAKGKKYGTVDLKNEVQIPFQYSDLQRIANIALYKAKKGTGQYQIINSKNEAISKDWFDEVANFERKDSYEYGENINYQALTFRNGKMRAIDEKGNYFTSETTMNPHIGYKTFDELKFALIDALDSQDNVLLKDFVDKIAPSEHILYYLKRNMFSNEPMNYIDISHIKERYYNDLMEFKYRYWNENSGYGYNRTSLTKVTDYTLYREGYITNARSTDPAFGNIKYMETFLRNAVKINGFWISSYFMKGRFNWD